MVLRRFRSLAWALCSLLVPAAAIGQNKISVALRPGVGFPGDLAPASFQTGVGFGAGLEYQALRRVALYALWDYYRFSATDKGGDITNAITNGPSAGVKFQGAFSNAVLAWASGGAAYTRVDVRRLMGDSGDYYPGWEVGAGLSIRIGSRLALSPSVRHREFNLEYEVIYIPEPPLGGDLRIDTENRWADYTAVEFAFLLR